MSEKDKEESEESELHPEPGDESSESEEETSLDATESEEEEGDGDDGDEDDDGEEGEEEDFDLEAQIMVFRHQIEEEPENCVHYYNLGEALMELGDAEGAQQEFELALQFDVNDEFGSIIHYALGELYYSQLMSGIQSKVVISSVGLHSAHKAGATITDVNDADYGGPISEFEKAVELLDKLKADDEIVEYVSKNAPEKIADLYYKWASDLIDKSRQIELYGGEVKDVKHALKLLKKTVVISPNHSQAQLMIKYGKKMLQEGWQAYDEYGFLAKEIPGNG
ncbi:MAG: hypothetical protein G3M78_06510 [Candidatus Nitrohelix vancouverensis]|uniref:Tetratricopeptide repeat protein n=1 Tax=Candidatus Nitrohelix vancouverensis TaxID=2705534 RepID=A0A7T0G373_9BACT|nr:MAG: hypothetical protein G3M78_06510 [Candidatus Nitrohelix vancouverensis]